MYAIPGIDGSIGTIQPVAEHLARSREVVVVDYRHETNRTLDELATEIAEAIRADGQGSFDLLGQSIGTVLAAQVATLHELPVRRVVLTSTFTRLRWRLLRAVAVVTRLTPVPLYRLTSSLVVAVSCGPVGDGADHPCFATSRDADKDAVARRTRWQVDRDFAPDLARLRGEILVLMGARDRFVPDAARELRILRRLFSDNAGARVEAIRGAGHIFLPSRAIGTANVAIGQFLDAP